MGTVTRLSEHSIWVEGTGRRAIHQYNIVVLPKGYNQLDVDEL